MPVLSECSDCNVTFTVCQFGCYRTTILVRHLFVRCTKSIRSTLSHPMCLKSILILLSHLHLGFRHILLPSDFSIRNLFCRIRATCPAYLDLLDLFTLITSGDQYKSWSSSLWNFLQCLVTSISGLNVPLSTLISNTPERCTGFKMCFIVLYTVC